jgi:hypothetical protein
MAGNAAPTMPMMQAQSTPKATKFKSIDAFTCHEQLPFIGAVNATDQVSTSIPSRTCTRCLPRV